MTFEKTNVVIFATMFRETAKILIKNHIMTSMIKDFGINHFNIDTNPLNHTLAKLHVKKCLYFF